MKVRIEIDDAVLDIEDATYEDTMSVLRWWVREMCNSQNEMGTEIGAGSKPCVLLLAATSPSIHKVLQEHFNMNLRETENVVDNLPQMLALGDFTEEERQRFIQGLKSVGAVFEARNMLEDGRVCDAD